MSATLEIVPSVLDPIRRTLVGLKMPRALEVLDQTIRQLERGEASALEVIDTLFAEDLTLRENRRVNMALRMAKLSTINPRRLRLLVPAFARPQPRSRPCSARLHRSQRGDPLPRPTTDRQEPPRHRPWRRGRELAKAEPEGQLRERIRFLCRTSLLIVDEIGYLPVIPGGGNLFFQLVNARCERAAMVLTSNRGFAEWGEVFGDPVVATALLDRLLHHAVVIQIEGSSSAPEHVRSKAVINSPIPAQPPRGRPPKNGAPDHPPADHRNPPPGEFYFGTSGEN